MKKLLGIALASVFGLFLLSGNAAALHIDFTSDLYAPADGEKTFSSDGLTLSAMPDTEDVALDWDTEDGIGIAGTFGYEADEVEWQEWLRIDFDASVLLTDIYLTDFFYEERNGAWYEETGMVMFLFADGTTSDILDFQQTDHDAVNGAHTIDVAGMIGDREVLGLGLSGKGSDWVVGQDHEFAVAGLNTASVPEPASLFLLGSGLLGLAGWRRKASTSK